MGKDNLLEELKLQQTPDLPPFPGGANKLVLPAQDLGTYHVTAKPRAATIWLFIWYFILLRIIFCDVRGKSHPCFS